MRILVTGGSGFIGSTIVDLLIADGHDVLVVDSYLERAHRRRPDYLNPGATYLEGDLGDATIAEQAVQGVEAVCHQAALVGLGVDFDDVVDYVTHNDLATAMLLRAFHRGAFAGRIVLASSMVVYGEGGFRCPQHGMVSPLPRSAERLAAGRYEPTCGRCGSEVVAECVDESMPCDPRNVYAATKLHQEHLLSSYSREHGAPLISLRYHNVYGPRMPRDTPYAGVAAVFRSAVARGEPPSVYEDGGQRRDFVHVSDVARANVAALLAPSSVHGPLNVASGEPHTVLDLAVALCDAAGDGAPRPQVVGGYRLGDVRHVFASPQRAERELGFRARVSFDAGVREFATSVLRD